ncbi:MerR family transcriptional regulator [Pediococcus ethanolidurans]|uniref:DNA-binding transcriptional regulator, MerR family n=1 Tax=Pediococcus ethanolidurans TaxID=319653 RepID=A0A0R2JY94_9LACO|nr:MerR family transcriptional regulator [Pediococcus ethanolidurans]KRN82184.1 hypothetical protein IV87_GL000419 [Pediococcus ethanolidurans]MBU7562755.1 MerR family transcriptional regulator [Pediococcus ethanolidurans]MCT4398226.1 MerR family transcriptional regulator [Pediococcus ethanolidurans]MCV3315348.1 MerR family transcriptional regulator [Pediococcus ethanolidurans]MCV3321412.1 MerR family transcriptional regulator [Pediococcus ethanolidurans]
MKIKDAAKLIGIPTETIYYYERAGIIPKVGRDKSGYRDYQTSDLNWLFMVKRFRQTGFSVASIKRFTDMLVSPEDHREEEKQFLNNQLAEVDQKIIALQESKAMLKYKIETFDYHLGLANDKEHPTPEKMWENPNFNLD